MITDIRKFCTKHHACSEGRDWAVANCTDMADAWDKNTWVSDEWLIWAATRNGVLDDRTLRLFACWSVRQMWHMLTDERSRNAVKVAERFADGEATTEELAAARADAWSAVRSAAESTAWSAAESAAVSAAESATQAAAWSAAQATWSAAESAAEAAAQAAVQAVARDAVQDAAWSAARANAYDAAQAAQAAWIRDNVPNPFSG